MIIASPSALPRRRFGTRSPTPGPAVRGRRGALRRRVGHDSRPDYLRLAEAIELAGRPPVMALTATATLRVADEIARRLVCATRRSCARASTGRTSRSTCLHSTERARSTASGQHSATCSGHDALPAIVYAGTRKDAEKLAGELDAHGLRAGAYHGGMDGEARQPCSAPSCLASSTPSPARMLSGWGSTRRTSAPSSIGRSRRASRRTTRRPAARAATESRRAPCCSPRARTLGA